MRKKNRLNMDLQFFAENSQENTVVNAETSVETQNTDTQQQTNDTATQQSNKKSDEIMIPKFRFDEVNTKYKDIQQQLDEIMQEKAAREKAEAEKRGEFERLYNEANEEAKSVKTKAETFEQRVQQLEGVIGQLLESKLTNVPEEFRDLIPENFSVEQKLEWITSAESKGLFTKKKQQQIGGDTNASDRQTTDLNTLSPIQLLKAGYGTK